MSYKKNQYKKNQVVSVISNVGEYVGKYISEDEGSITIGSPRMLISGDSGVGFARGCCVTGKEDLDHLTFYKAGVAFVTATGDVVEKAFIEATSGIVV